MIDTKVQKRQEKVYQHFLTGSTLNLSRKCGRCASANISSKLFSFSRPRNFATTEAFHDPINNLHRYLGVLQVKISNITNFYIVFNYEVSKFVFFSFWNTKNSKKTKCSVYSNVATPYT